MEQTGNFASFAKDELERAGWMAEESDYEGMVGEAVLELCEVFSAQGHSGMSAMITVDLFNTLASWHPLAPITNSPDEWMMIAEDDPRLARNDQGALWQSRRQPGCFSKDAGRSYYDIDERPSWSRRLLMRVFRVYRPKIHYSLPMRKGHVDD